jgi:manganese oxidase
MRHRRVGGVGAALLLALGIGGPARSQGAPIATAAIRVFQFQPGALDVRAGTRVMWTNQDDIAHTVTSGVPGGPDGRFDLPLAGKGVTASATFSDPGAFPYFCTRHASMRGQVVVR